MSLLGNMIFALMALASFSYLAVNLKKPMPLYFVYITAWATEDGVVQFRRDLYVKDGIGQAAAAY